MENKEIRKSPFGNCKNNKENMKREKDRANIRHYHLGN